MNIFCATCGKQLPADWQFPRCPYCGNELPKLSNGNLVGSEEYELPCAKEEQDSEEDLENYLKRKRIEMDEAREKRNESDDAWDLSHKLTMEYYSMLKAYQGGEIKSIADFELAKKQSNTPKQKNSELEIIEKEKKLKEINDIALSYYHGKGRPKNDKEAVKWFQIAAKQGFAASQDNLGYCYYFGIGVTQNYKEAVKWFRLAAEQGAASSQYYLGECYYFGLGVTQDYAVAEKMYRMAAELGWEDAKDVLKYCYKKGKAIDFAEAQYQLGQYNCGFNASLEDGLRRLRLSAEKGHIKAQFDLGKRYFDGITVAQDPKEAVKWFRMAAEQGDAQAQCYLGYCYEEGEGVAKNYKEAVKWYHLAAEQGAAQAQCNLGYCYEEGIGVDQDYKEAFYWYREAAEQGNARAQCNLGKLYYLGLGRIRDIHSARENWKLAAKQGYQKAKDYLNGELPEP